MSAQVILKRILSSQIKKDMLSDGELGFITDTEEAIIGTKSGYVVFAHHGVFLDGCSIGHDKKASYQRAYLRLPYKFDKKKEK